MQSLFRISELEDNTKVSVEVLSSQNWNLDEKQYNSLSQSICKNTAQQEDSDYYYYQNCYLMNSAKAVIFFKRLQSLQNLYRLNW